MQELNAVKLYAVILYLVNFCYIASVLLTPLLVRHTARNYHMTRPPVYDDYLFVSIESNGQILQSFRQG